MCIRDSIGPVMNEEMDPSHWLSQDGAPYAKLQNEDEEPETIAYDELIKSWQ